VTDTVRPDVTGEVDSDVGSGHGGAPAAGTWADEVADLTEPRQVVASQRRFTGRVWSVRSDTVDLGDGQTVVRDVVEHPGAVGVLALDDAERVLLVRQYRHPVGAMLWEPPAGLLDVDGEDPWAAAQRELYEEAHLQARDWRVLVDYHNSPGGTTEVFRCYLARGITVPERDRHAGTGEERDMPVAWVPLDEAVDLVFSGRLHNPTAVAGVLAAHAARARGFDGLRPADAPWPERDAVRRARHP
jgi:ADP-ribose pyrophosphatase